MVNRIRKRIEFRTQNGYHDAPATSLVCYMMPDETLTDEVFRLEHIIEPFEIYCFIKNYCKNWRFISLILGLQFFRRKNHFETPERNKGYAREVRCQLRGSGDSLCHSFVKADNIGKYIDVPKKKEKIVQVCSYFFLHPRYSWDMHIFIASQKKNSHSFNFSGDFHSVLTTCLDTGFTRLLDKVAEYYRPAHTDGEQVIIR